MIIRGLYFAVMLLVASCGALPASGPGRAGIDASSTFNGGATHIVPVDMRIAKGMASDNPYGFFPGSFFQSGKTNFDQIKAGDILNVTVWENVDNGVFASLGARVTQLSPMRVDNSGNIFMPYVGTVKASGRTTAQLRSELARRLAPQTPDPQVEVFREAGLGGGVRIFQTASGTDGAGGGGLVPFNAGNTTLSSMLASAGVSGDPQSTRITLRRGSQAGTILLEQLYDNSRYDVPLRDSDQITVEQDRRYVRLLGASSQGVLEFPTAELTVLDAISRSGGLNSSTSDPSGVFVLRTVSADEASSLLRTTRFGSPQNFAFVINLSTSDGLFVADSFKLRGGDTVYVTEAPYVTWTKVISSLTGAVGSVTSLESTATSLVGQ